MARKPKHPKPQKPPEKAQKMAEKPTKAPEPASGPSQPSKEPEKAKEKPAKGAHKFRVSGPTNMEPLVVDAADEEDAKKQFLAHYSINSTTSTLQVESV